MMKRYYKQMEQKKKTQMGVAIRISDKIYFKLKLVKN